jgi:hypothetical protein
MKPVSIAPPHVYEFGDFRLDDDGGCSRAGMAKRSR